jgi:uncharacterized protein (DUF58 family)
MIFERPMTATIAELHYRLRRSAGGHFPGHHRSRRGDSGFEFRAHAPLHNAPDVRRLDLHASLRDPFGQWLVRLHSQRMAVPVVVVADLSASMAFVGAQRKLDVLADFVQSLAWSAWRTGDSFSFVGCDATVRTELLLPATRQRGAGVALAATLRGLQLASDHARSALGLQHAHQHLPHQHALVFLISDFHLPLPQLRSVLDSLAAHQVVPVVLWQQSEFGPNTTSGLADVRDPESGERHWLWWRPALRQRWQAAQQQRWADLQQVFAQAQLSPLLMPGAFDADAVTRHFYA